MSTIISESSREEQSPKIITFYKDVIDEVDVHFMRALGGGDGENDEKSNCNEVERCIYVSTSEENPTSPIKKEAKKLSDSSSPYCEKEMIEENSSTSNSLNPSIDGTHFHQSTVPISSSSKDKITPPLAPSNTTPAIIYPDLASYLVHPNVDSFADAPRIHGQPHSSPAPTMMMSPTNNEYGHHLKSVSMQTQLMPPSYASSIPYSANFATTGPSALNYHSVGPSVHNYHHSATSASGFDYMVPTQPSHQSSYTYDIPPTGGNHYDYNQSCYSTNSSVWNIPPPPPLSHKPLLLHYDNTTTYHHTQSDHHYTNSSSHWSSSAYTTTGDNRLPINAPVVDNELHHILKL